MFDRRPSQSRAESLITRGAWGVGLAVLLEVVACSIALVGLVHGSGWWLALVGISALLVVVPAVLRTAGLSAWLALLIDLLVFALVIQLAYARPGSLFGVIPTTESVGELRGLFARALAAIQNQHVPAEPLPELVFFIVLFGGVLSLVLELLAVVLRIPAVTALVLAGVLVVPAILQPGGLSLNGLGAAAAAWFVLLAADGRVRFGSRGGRPVALAAGASVTLLSLVIAATAPGFSEPGRAVGGTGPLVLGNSVNPLIDLGADLRRPTPVDVLRYTTAAAQPQYLQLTTLDEIHGTEWTHTPGGRSALHDGSELTLAPGLDPALSTAAATQTATIDVEDLSANWLPVPYPTTKVVGSSASTFEADDLTVFAGAGVLSGETYTTTSLDLQPTGAQLAAEGPYNSQQFTAVGRDLRLPGAVPAIITDTAKRIAAGADGTSEFDIALAIQNYFQDAGNGFTYSTDSPDTMDGASLDVIAKFLSVKEGYCVHYASAMAVLARVLGIPSRVAIGYLPGRPVSISGKQVTYQVDSSDLHAWPQLYFPGVGWLNFEPTVSRGAAPSYTLTTTPDAGEPSLPRSEAAVPSAATPVPSASAAAAAKTAQGADTVASRGGAPLALGILIVLGALAVPAGARALRRRTRLARLRDQGAPPGLAWDEIRDTAQDLGFQVSPTETPRAFATRLRADWHPDAARQRDLDELLDQLELTEFGPPRPMARHFELADKTVSVTAAMRASRPWRMRVMAIVAPVSLFTGLGERRRGSARWS